MARAQLGAVLRHVRRLSGAPRPSEPTDGQLLEQFIRHRDEGPFAALLARHGPMVLGVCRRILHNEQDAEDAFQATFLVLARKARSIAKRDSVGSWLYGVAYRIAVRARARAARRQELAMPTRLVPGPEPPDEAAGRELRAVLDEELQRLPEAYRAPLVLCCLEGRSKREAAEQLGWKLGTVSGRLARARERLRGRLIRRGLVLSSGALAILLAREAATAAVPSVVARATVQAAIAFAAGGAAGLTASATALAEGVIRTMWLTRVKVMSAVLLTITMVGGGLGVSSYRTPAAEARADDRGAADQPPDKRADDKAEIDRLRKLLEDERARAEQAIAKSRAMAEAQARAAAQARDAEAQARAVAEEQLAAARQARTAAQRTLEGFEKAQKELQVIDQEALQMEAKWTAELIKARQEQMVTEERLRRQELELAAEREREREQLKTIQREFDLAQQRQRTGSAELEAKARASKDATEQKQILQGIAPLEEAVVRARINLDDFKNELKAAEEIRANLLVGIRKEQIAAEEQFRLLERRQALERHRSRGRMEEAEERLRQPQGGPRRAEPADRRMPELERKLDQLLQAVTELRRELKRP